MKARQISKVIGEKVAELAKAHPEISGVLMKNSIVTGGCIASMLLKEKVRHIRRVSRDLQGHVNHEPTSERISRDGEDAHSLLMVCRVNSRRPGLRAGLRPGFALRHER